MSPTLVRIADRTFCKPNRKTNWPMSAIEWPLKGLLIYLIGRSMRYWDIRRAFLFVDAMMITEQRTPTKKFTTERFDPLGGNDRNIIARLLYM